MEIWKQRNQFLFAVIHSNAVNIITGCVSWAKSVKRNALVRVSCGTCGRISTGWEPPADNSVKLNTDGAWRSSDRAGCSCCWKVGSG